MVMKTMQQLMTDGGKCIWVAPSGGRDRPSDDGKYEVAPFDSKSIEMFRLMSAKADGTATSGQPRGNLEPPRAISSHLRQADRPTHFYPLSMFTYPICPPPTTVGGEIGARRFPAAIASSAPAAFSDRLEPCRAQASSGQSSTTRRRSTLARRWTCRASRRGA